MSGTTPAGKAMAFIGACHREDSTLDPPKKVLRTLINAEITSRDASNQATRLKSATFPVVKTLDEFNVNASSLRRLNSSCATTG